MTTNRHVKKEDDGKLAQREKLSKTNDPSLIPGPTCGRESTPTNCRLTCAPWHTCAHTHLHTK